MLTAQDFVSVLVGVLGVLVFLGSAAYLVLLERKIAAWVQDRIGPNRVGFSFGLPFMPQFHFWGLGQPLADGLKMFLKEDYTPGGVDRPLFLLAPVLGIVPALIGWAVLPWGGYWDFPGLRIGDWEIVQPGQALVAAAAIDVGVIFILSIGALAVYGVVVAGYASNNKYAFLGGLRATAQMLSYEIPLGVSVLVILLMSGSLEPSRIVDQQANGVWNIFYQPVLAVIFLTCLLAEANRAPFDLSECEQELVGGFHTEYTSMKLGLMLLGEYIHMTVGMGFFVLMFLGGWDLPVLKEPAAGGIGWVLVKTAVYGAKVLVMIGLVMLIRWTLPRFRFDQLMRLAWCGLVPMAVTILLISGVLEFLVVMGKTDRPTAHALMSVGNVVVGVGFTGLAGWAWSRRPVNRRVPLEGSRFSPA